MNPTTPQNDIGRDDEREAEKPAASLVVIVAEINGRLSDLGECAMIHHRGGRSYVVGLDIDASFRRSETVAGWFHELGATSVVIDHTLYSDDDDGDRDGLTHGRQAWTVYFDLPGGPESEAE